ncbi:MAG: hypothetical protein ACP6IP_09835 [Candidatus Njordarchaeia archaeon]
MENTDKVIVRSYPKAYALFLTGIVALIFAPVQGVLGSIEAISKGLGFVFMIVFFFNVLIVAFDFSEGKTYGFIAFIIIMILLYIILAQSGIIPENLGKGFINSLDITLSAQAYAGIALSIFIMMFIAWLNTRFNYWIIESNQITRKRGLFGKVERYSTAGVRYEIEIDDVFEYLIFKAGSLTLYFPTKKIAEKIPMVPNIKKVEEKIAMVLGRVEVGEEEEETSELAEMGAG